MAQETSTVKEKRPTVLVVDDEQIIRDLLKAVLSDEGYEVFTAASGREGLALFQGRRPQFTLLNLLMPEMSGIEVLKHIRKLDRQADVMILTAWGTPALEHEARQLGVTGFLSKRMMLNTVMSSRERILQRPDKTTTAAAPSRKPEGTSILVVTATPMMHDVLAKAIAKLGHQVRHASSSTEALTLVDEETPALIILDMFMPGMHGIEVLRQLKERRITSGLILLAGIHDEKMMTEVSDLGVVGIIGKPVDIGRLTLAVKLGLDIKDR